MLGPEYCGAKAGGSETAIEISLFRCSWNSRVAVTASLASRFFRITLEDITTMVAMAAMSRAATASVEMTSTRVKPRWWARRVGETDRREIIGRSGTR